MLKVKANEKLQKIGTFAGIYSYIMGISNTCCNRKKIPADAFFCHKSFFEGFVSRFKGGNTDKMLFLHPNN